MNKINNDFFLTARLMEQEKKEICEVDQKNFEGKGHFGSYYGLLTGLNRKWVKSHAYMNERMAINYAQQVINILREYNILSENISLLDVGCGPGVITNAISNLLRNSRLMGIDISRHAVLYAQKKYQNCSFIHAAVDKQIVFPQNYNVIHAREFYPFTRTNDVMIHLNYLTLFSKFLFKNGLVILSFVHTTDSFADTYFKINKELLKIGMSSVVRKPIASYRLLSFLPFNFSVRLTKIALNLMHKEMSYFYILRKMI